MPTQQQHQRGSQRRFGRLGRLTRVVILLLVAAVYAGLIVAGLIYSPQFFGRGDPVEPNQPGRGWGLDPEAQYSAIMTSIPLGYVAPNIADENNFMNFVVDDITFDFYGFDGEQVCINRLTVINNEPSPRSTDLLGNKPLCQIMKTGVAGKRTIVPGRFDTSDIKLRVLQGIPVPHNTAWFPYDRLSTRIGVQASYSISNGSTTTSFAGFPILTVNPVSYNDQWISTLSFATDNVTPTMWGIVGSNNYYFFDIQGHRPLFMQVITGLLLSLTLVLVVASVAIESPDTFLEFAAALFFGIFTLRQLLIPDGVQSYTTIDYTLLGTYLVLGISVVLHFLGRRTPPTSTAPATAPQQITIHQTRVTSLWESLTTVVSFIVAVFVVVFTGRRKP